VGKKLGKAGRVNFHLDVIPLGRSDNNYDSYALGIEKKIGLTRFFRDT